MLGRAGAPEGGAVVRLLQATENLPAYAGGRLPCLQSTHFESMLGIVLAELVAQAKPALGDAADPPPLAIAHLERRPHQTLSGQIAGAGHDGGGMILEADVARLEGGDGTEDAVQEVVRLATVVHDGDAVETA